MSVGTELVVLLEKIEQVVGKIKGRRIANLTINKLEEIKNREMVINKRELELNIKFLAEAVNNQFGENSPNDCEAPPQQFPIILTTGIIILIVWLILKR